MTIQEAAAIWGITERRVNELCKSGRIFGAYKNGRRWIIPDDAKKPFDKRSREDVEEKNMDSTRKPLPIGVSDYRDACSNYYYVDKTLFIKEFLDERPKVSLFTRPRRFGKTLNMDMLRTYFEKTDEDTSVYFQDKKIWKAAKQLSGHFSVIQRCKVFVVGRNEPNHRQINLNGISAPHRTGIQSGIK